MKNLISKVRARKQPKEPVGRITNDTLAEHREKVLAGGRKFKYPVQYARHKLVINAIIISAAAIVLLVALGWYLLYPAQNTSEFMYRVTKVAPVPVAVIDGQQVRYSDYLMKYRIALHYLVEKERTDVRTDDGKRQIVFLKENAMNDAVADAYAEKLANEYGLKVSSEDIEDFLKRSRQYEGGGISEATQAGVLADYYGWTLNEYKGVVAKKLLRQQVSYKIDDKARTIGAEVEKASAAGASLQDISSNLNAEDKNSVIYTPPVWVPNNNQDNGLAEAARKLDKGQLSAAIKTSNDGYQGYYYVKLVNSNDTHVEYEYIFVPLTVLDSKIESIKKEGKVKYFIKLESSDDRKQKKVEE